jgi:hypothetical protein
MENICLVDKVTKPYLEIVPRFKFSGHYLMEFWSFDSMVIRDSHRPTVDSNMPPI